MKRLRRGRTAERLETGVRDLVEAHRSMGEGQNGIDVPHAGASRGGPASPDAARPDAPEARR